MRPKKGLAGPITLFEAFCHNVLTPSEVIQEAIKKKLVSPNDSPKYIKKNFSRLVEELQIDAYRIYLAAEKRAGQAAIREVLIKKTTPEAGRDAVIDIVCEMFTELDRFFLSLTQSRRPRAGSAFEIVLKSLFKRLGYPFDEQQVINGKPDFLMPGRKHYDSNPMDCIIFTAKRSLRERWRQIVTEGTRGLGFYLASIDESISSIQLNEMKNHRIYLVVPAGVKDRIAHYSEAVNVITFEEFFRHHLDPALARWKAKGLV